MTRGSGRCWVRLRRTETLDPLPPVASYVCKNSTHADYPHVQTLCAALVSDFSRHRAKPPCGYGISGLTRQLYISCHCTHLPKWCGREAVAILAQGIWRARATGKVLLAKDAPLRLPEGRTQYEGFVPERHRALSAIGGLTEPQFSIRRLQGDLRVTDHSLFLGSVEVKRIGLVTERCFASCRVMTTRSPCDVNGHVRHATTARRCENAGPDHLRCDLPACVALRKGLLHRLERKYSAAAQN